MPRYKCESIAALDIALGGLPAKMQVEADVGTGVSAKTVGELRKDNDPAGAFFVTNGTGLLGRSTRCRLFHSHGDRSAFADNARSSFDGPTALDRETSTGTAVVDCNGTAKPETIVRTHQD
jgi:hypothetical protein